MEQLGKVCLKRLKRLREKASWKTKKERLELFHQLHDLIYNWTGKLPNLWDIFLPEEMDWILVQDIKNCCKRNSKLSGGFIIEFVIRAGYKDRPEIDDDGKPLLRRTTAVHYAAKKYEYSFIHDLFKIYDRFDVNYVDDDGLSHFHVACQLDCTDVVEKFLELGQDPNSRVQQTGDSPLHSAVSTSRDCIEVVKLLIENGADPNSANEEGTTALHMISNRIYYYEYVFRDFVQTFFKIIEDRRRTIQLEARDNLGRTALELAVATLAPELVRILLDRGADISNLVFPTELGEGVDKMFDEYYDVFEMRVASRVLAVLDCLEQRGYQLDRGGILAVMKLFLKHECFRRSSEATAFFDLYVLDGRSFEAHAKKMMINPSLSLHELVRLRPGEAEKRLTYLDYYKLTSQKIRNIHHSERKKYVCTAYLNEIMARGFCRRGALDFFLELTHYRLPVLCCERIFDYLGNEDLCRIGLATDVRTPKFVTAH
uniref:Uncharacterized protein n=1 Tax=Trichogramma kaykai TaxID=54128 RepID=A0ABD2WK05_9HYME